MGDAGTPSREEVEQALLAVADMAARSRAAQAKFAPGTAQHTLQKNRIAALGVAAALLKAEAAGRADADAIPKEALEQAAAPLASLASKSEKARQKLAPGSWQHAMLGKNLRALRLAAELLAKKLDAPGPNRARSTRWN